MGWNPTDLGSQRDPAGWGRSGDLGGGLRGPVGWDPVGWKGLSILESALREILQGLGGSMGTQQGLSSDGGRLWDICGSIGDLVVLGHSREPSRVWEPWGALKNLVGRASL